MQTDKSRRDAAPEEIYVPNLAKSIAPFLIGLAAALAGDTALYFGWYAAALLCYVILMISIVWIVKAQRRREKADYHLYRRISKDLNMIEEFEKRLSTAETNLDLKADKPARSNIRPGSVQSDVFMSMINERS